MTPPRPSDKPAPATDSQLADWIDQDAPPAWQLTDLDDLDTLLSHAAEALHARGAAHPVEDIALYVLHDGSGEALLAVERPGRPRLCTLTLRFPYPAGCTARQALTWLLDTAAGEDRRLLTWAASGWQHGGPARLGDEARQAASAAAALDQDDLDELVRDTASRAASAACNGGREDQVAFLIEHLGPGRALREAQAAADDN
jgi:hypothetical protein